MLLVSGATKTMSRIDDPRLGALLRPGNGNRPGAKPWAADNGAFGNFDARAFVQMLGQIAGKPGCLWVAAPDVVCDATATLAKFDAWEPVLRELGVPVAFVAQNGIARTSIPWDRFTCLFLGGDDSFKLGAEGRSVALEAKRRGKLLHMGRVNSLTRIRYALSLACDSFDGTAASRWSERYIPWMLQWLDRIEFLQSAQFELPLGTSPKAQSPW